MATILTPTDYATLSVLYAREGAVIADAELPALCEAQPTFYNDLSRLVALELVDYERAEGKHYLNYDGFDVVEGYTEEEEEMVADLREARAEQPPQQYTIGTFKWLLIGIATVVALATVVEWSGVTGGRSSQFRGPDRDALGYIGLDSATWVVVREQLAAKLDSVRAAGGDTTTVSVTVPFTPD